MFLPLLAPYPFVVLHLLFCGRQTGPDLRRTLAALGHARSAPSFSRTMTNLDRLGYVTARYVARPGNGQPIRELCYEVTDLGVLAWTNTQKHFANFAPPSPDFLPAESDALETAAYDPEMLAARDRDEFRALFGQFARSTRQRRAE
jgi:hypothetical protein